MLTYVPRHFEIKELVCPHIHAKLLPYGDYWWRLFDPKLLKMLDWVRDRYNKPVFLNNWDSVTKGTIYDERGARCNLCEIIKGKTEAGIAYLGGHVFWKASDFIVSGTPSEEVREDFRKRSDILPFPIRIEKNVSWVHMDTIDMGVPLYEFNG